MNRESHPCGVEVRRETSGVHLSGKRIGYVTEGIGRDGKPWTLAALCSDLGATTVRTQTVTDLAEGVATVVRMYHERKTAEHTAAALADTGLAVTAEQMQRAIEKGRADWEDDLRRGFDDAVESLAERLGSRAVL